MMDYYGYLDMPSIKERKESLYNFLERIMIQEPGMILIGKKELDDLLTDIVYKTPNLSYTGYSVFGMNDERTRLLDALKLLKN